MPPFPHPDFVWPTIRTLTIKLRRMPDVLIGASVSLDTGKPVVDFRVYDGEAETLTPAEARRLAAALVRAADCCDAKSAAAKAWHSSPVVEESTSRHTQPPRAQAAKTRVEARSRNRHETRPRPPSPSPTTPAVLAAHAFASKANPQEAQASKGRGASVGGTDPCTCGHTPEEHGHDPDHASSTGCTECDCIAYEADA